MKNSCRLLLVALLLSCFVWAQSDEGRILGTITDATGSVVVGAKITITNGSTNVSRALTSNRVGDYLAPGLRPGQYVVTAEAPGFKKAVSTPVTLEVARDVRVDLSLHPGGINEVLEVTAEGTLADTSDSTLNGVLSNKAITELPLQGRDFQNLLDLHPGVQRTPGGGFHSVTSNGNRPDDNNFFIDGADDNDVYYGETVVNDAGITGTPASFLPIDAIEEFNTQTGPAADYGVKPGVVTNIGIKSGTNAIHGSAYYFQRNEAFDARNYFNPAPQPAAALLLHQFGASLGGPIIKDKWFYFANYEGIRDKVGNPGLTDSPVTVSLANQLGSDASTYSIVDAINNCKAAGTCSPLSLSLSSLFLPNPGFTLSQSDPAAIDFDFVNKNNGDNFVFKTDYVLNSKNVLSGRWIYSSTKQTEEDTVPLRPDWLSTTSPISHVFGVSLASTPSANWSNEARFSFNSFNEAIFPVDHTVNPTTYGLNTGVTDPRLFGFPRISPGAEFNYMGGNSSWPLYTTPSKTYSFSDTATFTHGRHSLRFGGIGRYGDVSYYRAGYGRGRIDFRHLDNFVTGDVRRWRKLYGDPGRDVSQKSFGLFMQDDYRFAPNLTFNLGLRYDVTYPIKDSRNLLANYVPTLSNGQPGGVVQVGKGISQPYPTNYNNVSPRVGMAWDVFGKGKTVVRAAFGMIFEQPSIRTFMFNGGGLNLNPSGLDGVTPGNGNITSFLHVQTDNTGINWSQNGNVFPDASVNFCKFDNVNFFNQCDLFGVNQHLKTPYVFNWNFNIQQQVASNTLLQVAYVANHGVNLYSVTDINQVNPALDDGFEQVGRPLVTSCPVSQGGLGLGGPCFPYIGFLNYLSNQSNSIYHSLQVTLTKRYSKGLYLLAGYTYAHAIDTATSNLAGVPPNSLNYAAERGNGDFDIRNRFTLSATYDLPSRKHSFAQMLEGWQVTSVVSLEGGEPYTLGDFGNDTSTTGEFNDRWDMTGSPANIHWSAVNSIPYIDPSQFNTDSNGNVTTGVNSTAQRCVSQAFSFGGQDAANQLVGGPFGITGGCFVSGATVITPPAQGTQGSMGRNIFRGPSFRNWDASVSKVWQFNERFKLQLRGEFFNLTNHTNFDVFTLNTDLSSPLNLGLARFTPDVAASNPVIGSGGSRHIQVGAKLIW